MLIRFARDFFARINPFSFVGPAPIACRVRNGKGHRQIEYLTADDENGTSSLRPLPALNEDRNLHRRRIRNAVSPVRTDLIARDRVDYMDVSASDGVCRSHVHPLPRAR